MIRGYFNQKAAIWDETVAEKDAAKLKQMGRRLNTKLGATVLDVGTGTGVFVPFVLNQIGEGGRLVALDFAEKMLRTAKAKGFSDKINYLCADVSNIPLDNEIFDTVICYSSFPHFQDKPRALAEINRITKSGGKLLICHTSSRDTINEIHRSIPTVQNDIIPDKREMHELLSQAGFTDIKIENDSESYLASAKKTEHKK